MKYIIILLLSSLWLASSCQRLNHENYKDIFYSRKGGFDYVRVPFIKPYEAIKLNGTNEWIMNLETTNLQFSVSNIKEVSVVNGFILIHSTNTFLKGNTVKEAWFVVIPSERIEVGFDNYNKFYNYLFSKGFKKKPLLNDINELFQKFNR